MRTNRRADRWADRWTGPVAWACTPSLPFQAAGNLAEAFCPYRSIPASFWWAIVTMTTVGYGDGYPMTAEGRTLAVFAMISGILIIAMPITVIGDNFSKAYDSQSFEESLIARCTRQVSAREAKPGMEEGTDMIQLEVLMQLLRELELRGNLKVQRPKDIEALTKLLAEYDAGGDGVLRMQEREWRVFLHDVVIDPSDFTNATVSKLARDVHNAQVEAAPRPHMTATTRPRPNPSIAPTRIRAPHHVEAAAWAAHAARPSLPHPSLPRTRWNRAHLLLAYLTRWSRRDCTRSLTRCAQICAWRSMPSRRRRGRLVSCMLFEDACAQGTWAAPPAVLECAGLASLLIGGRWWKDSVDRYG